MQGKYVPTYIYQIGFAYLKDYFTVQTVISMQALFHIFVNINNHTSQIHVGENAEYTLL